MDPVWIIAIIIWAFLIVYIITWIGTLVKLEYRHIKRDLEKGALPIHVHVEAEITKGKYYDYDTFIG